MIDLIAAAGIGGIIGALVMRPRIRRERYLKEQWERLAKGASDRATARLRRLSDADAAHTRCADALATCQRKLSAIRDLLDTPRTIRKGELAMILDGEVA